MAERNSTYEFNNVNQQQEELGDANPYASGPKIFLDSFGHKKKNL